MLLSIIIPAKNEERYLSKLLESIKKQDFTDCEIIVADAGSKDRTKKIADEYGAKIVRGGVPAVGRNAGAAVAKGDILLFLDADVILPDRFIKKALAEFEKRKLGVASFPLRPITKSLTVKILFEATYNIPVPRVEKIVAFGGMGVLIRKNLQRKLKGYNEHLKLCEDHDFVRRAARIEKYGVIRSTYISVSVRRFSRDGWGKILLTYIFSELYNDFIGPIKTDIFKYKFGRYSKKIEH